jgi:hypothetical protein
VDGKYGYEWVYWCYRLDGLEWTYRGNGINGCDGCNWVDWTYWSNGLDGLDWVYG